MRARLTPSVILSPSSEPDAPLSFVESDWRSVGKRLWTCHRSSRVEPRPSPSLLRLNSSPTTNETFVRCLLADDALSKPPGFRGRRRDLLETFLKAFSSIRSFLPNSHLRRFVQRVYMYTVRLLLLYYSFFASTSFQVSLYLSRYLPLLLPSSITLSPRRRRLFVAVLFSFPLLFTPIVCQMYS